VRRVRAGLTRLEGVTRVEQDPADDRFVVYYESDKAPDLKQAVASQIIFPIMRAWLARLGRRLGLS
jgi:hypothetical protein